ncbi:MAG: excisionase family DNA-binding protein [Firmicutes bacterium]|nr:excisionase family DNA-binding protein [Bacillota bacterium]
MVEMKMAMTIEEAAEYTSIGRNTMRQLVEWKMIPVLRVGRKILIPTEELKGFLQLNQNVDLRKRDEIRPWRG